MQRATSLPKHTTKHKGQERDMTEKELDDFLLNDQEMPKHHLPTRSDQNFSKAFGTVPHHSSHPNLLTIKPRISVDKTWINQNDGSESSEFGIMRSKRLMNIKVH